MPPWYEPTTWQWTGPPKQAHLCAQETAMQRKYCAACVMEHLARVSAQYQVNMHWSYDQAVEILDDMEERPTFRIIRRRFACEFGWALDGETNHLDSRTPTSDPWEQTR